MRSAVDTEDTADIGDIVDRSGMVDCKDMVDFDDIAHFAGIVDPDDSADSMDRNYYRRVGGEGNWVEHASEYGGGDRGKDRDGDNAEVGTNTEDNTAEDSVENDEMERNKKVVALPDPQLCSPGEWEDIRHVMVKSDPWVVEEYTADQLEARMRSSDHTWHNTRHLKD